MDPVRDQLQKALGETYRVDRELGGGGMSRVFLSTETALDRRVVLKILPPELASGVSVERFKREISMAARLQHAHIVPLLSAGDANGLPWFSMPFVEGESLRARLGKGELPIAEAVRTMRDVASALAYAHGKGNGGLKLLLAQPRASRPTTPSPPPRSGPPHQASRT